MVLRRLLLGLAAVPAAVFPLAGQGRSEIAGTVISDSASAPLPGARVIVTRPWGTDTSLTADARGRFALRKLTAGRYWIKTSWRGIVSPILAVDLREGERFEAEFTVRAVAPRLGDSTTPAVLPELVTTGISDRATTFDQRMARGLGLYLTEAEIERRGSTTVSDLLRTMPGVRINCNREGCYVVIQRAAPGCVPAYYIDDMLADARTAMVTRGSELRGIEVYQGVSQLPPELARGPVHGRCGVIAIWTKRGPPMPPPAPPPG